MRITPSAPSPRRWQWRSRSLGFARRNASRPPHRGRRILAVEEDALPDLEIHEQPETLAVIRRPGQMLGGQARERGRLEEPAVPRVGPEDELLDDVPEVGPEPAAHRHREAHLRAREDGRWH